MSNIIVTLALEKAKISGNLHTLVESKQSMALKRSIQDLIQQLEILEPLFGEVNAWPRMGEEEGTRVWLGEARDLAFEAENTMESLVMEVDEQELKEKYRSKWSPLRYARLPSLLLHFSRHKQQKQLIHKISKMCYGIRELCVQSNYFATSAPQKLNELSCATRPERHGFDAIYVAGRRVLAIDDDKAEQVLLDANVAGRRVLAIVGMPGIGKTTLVQRLYHSLQTYVHFEIRAWASITRDCTARGLMLIILKQVTSVNKHGAKIFDMDHLKERLVETLAGKRYLIVLDDVDSMSAEYWEQVGEAFPDSENGSRLLITSRSPAGIPPIITGAADDCYTMPLLDHRKSWEIFLKSTFPLSPLSPNCPEELQDIAHELVKRCEGNPFSLKLVRALASTKTPDQIGWGELLGAIDLSLQWHFYPEPLRLPMLSYFVLPDNYVRSCFLFLACFSRDAEMEASKLMSMWIAEGLVPESYDPSHTMEDTARIYLMELVSRSMLHAVTFHPDGQVVTCRMQHQFHDMCTDEAEKNGLIPLHEIPSSMVTSAGCNIHFPDVPRFVPDNPPRRLRVYDYFLVDDIYKGPSSNTRSLFTPRPTSSSFERDDARGLFKFLRVFEMTGAKKTLTTLPKAIKHMIFLRYLGLRGCSRLTHLPWSVLKYLPHLQTLDIRETGITQLPQEFGEITELRHLLTSDPTVFTSSVANLTQLQTLDTIDSRGEWMQDLGKLWKIRVLGITGITESLWYILPQELPNMIYLSSLYLHSRETIPSEMVLNSLSSHLHLQKLHLRGRLRPNLLPSIDIFPKHIKVLTLEESRLDQDPMETLGKLPSLVHLTLKYATYTGKKMVCAAATFPRLQKLELMWQHNLVNWRVEQGSMPALASLSIEMCMKLAMLPPGLHSLTLLKELKITDLREEFVQRLLKDGPDWEKIKHVSSVKFNS